MEGVTDIMRTELDPAAIVLPGAVNTQHCWRCGHTWLPRYVGRPPLKCPRCKSPYYTTPRLPKPRLGKMVDRGAD